MLHYQSGHVSRASVHVQRGYDSVPSLPGAAEYEEDMHAIVEYHHCGGVTESASIQNFNATPIIAHPYAQSAIDAVTLSSEDAPAPMIHRPSPELKEIPRERRGRIRVETSSLPKNTSTANIEQPKAPVENKPTDIVPFAYLPPYIRSSDESQEVLASMDNTVVFQPRHGFLNTLRRGVPPPLTTFLKKPMARREVATFRAVKQENGLFINHMLSEPFYPLQEGCIVECVGSMVGEWKVSDWQYRRGQWTIMLWISMETRHYSLVQAEPWKVVPPSLATRARALGRTVFKAFKHNNNKIESVTVKVEV
ncbi:hypothetical protein FB451DRAFT_1191893 [Mycena latifolia]|nr:hypothetical protein FB451DRAFT_1191893 [Mycena latifolia]